MLLLYDGQCSVCRNLAYKIHLATGETVEIEALETPRARQVLEQHYPGGWEHDFYVVDGEVVSKGPRALPRLTKKLGVRRMLGLMAEYGQYRLSPRTCGANGTNGADGSKRNFLKAAAVAPLLLGFSQVRRHSLLDEPSLGFQVAVAEVERWGDGFRARIEPCKDCLRGGEKLRGVPQGSAAHPIENVTLVQEELAGLTAEGAAHFKVQRVQYQKEVVRGGEIDRKVMRVHSGMLQHPLYDLAINIGQGRSTTLSGMARHHLPAPVLDYVVYKTEGDDARGFLAALAYGTERLAEYHDRQGRAALAASYREIATGLTAMIDRFDQAVGETLLPGKNELVLTSMPEALRFAKLPSHFQHQEIAVDEGGCDCSCSCGACCSCGCGLGLCIGPLPCDCDCCIGCGCGCGCCA